MKIPKPIRHLIQLVIFCGLCLLFAMLAARLPRVWGIVLFLLSIPVAFFTAFAISILIDQLDSQSRRRSDSDARNKRD